MLELKFVFDKLIIKKNQNKKQNGKNSKYRRKEKSN